MRITLFLTLQIESWALCFHSPDTQMQIDNSHPLHNIIQNNDTESLDVPITEAKIRLAINKLKVKNGLTHAFQCYK